MRTAGLRRRVVLGAATISGLAAVVLVVVVQVVLELTAASSVDTVLADRASLVAGSVRSTSTGLRVPDASLGPGVAVFADGSLVAGQVPPALAGEVADLAVVDRATVRSVGDEFRVRARPFRTTDGATGVVVVAERSEPYEGDERAALVVSLVAGLLLVALSTGLASWATRRVLRPVSQMATTAEEWSERDLDRRFGLGPPTDELRELGRTLDGLLEKVSRTIRGEQRLTSELAHELRTPLTAVMATADLLTMRDDLDEEVRDDLREVRAACRAMATSVTTLLDLARDNGSRLTATCALAEVVAAVLAEHAVGTHAGAGVDGRVEVDVAPGLRAVAPADLAVRALGPLVDNALRAGDRVVVRARAVDDQVVVEVDDDGPGLPAGVDDLFEPGVSHRAGTGLGLPLSRRVARSLGGEVEVTGRTDARGTRSVLRLPGERRTAQPTSRRR